MVDGRHLPWLMMMVAFIIANVVSVVSLEGQDELFFGTLLNSYIIKNVGIKSVTYQELSKSNSLVTHSR